MLGEYIGAAVFVHLGQLLAKTVNKVLQGLRGLTTSSSCQSISMSASDVMNLPRLLKKNRKSIHRLSARGERLLNTVPSYSTRKPPNSFTESFASDVTYIASPPLIC
jgi:hypothetical protein